MKNAILLHGRPTQERYFSPSDPSDSNAYWFPWLQKQLLIHGISAQAPEILEPYNPRYENWAREIERYDNNPDTILVGHSCGGGAIVRWLSENKDVQVGKVVLVAPWIDIEKDDWPLFDFEIDRDIVARTKGITIFHSTNDAPEIVSSVKVLREKIRQVKYCEFENYGHFTFLNEGEQIEGFPGLLHELIGG